MNILGAIILHDEFGLSTSMDLRGSRSIQLKAMRFTLILNFNVKSTKLNKVNNTKS